MNSIEVPLGGGRTYSVHVGENILGMLPGVIAACVPNAKRAAIVTQAGIVEAAVVGPAPAAIVETGIEQRTFLIGDGEQHKRLVTVEALCQSFSEWGMTRNDVVVAVGGGIVTDVGGFAAACFLRGISVIYVSTTLLGMIDAAVGGKTGVNLEAGKNLFGAFWQPSAVLCDVTLLKTMAPRELACGLGEMAKYHFLGVKNLNAESMVDRVSACVAHKAAVVVADEREGGIRATLNYGHTLAHALEIAGDHELRHGEAVAIGLIYAAELAMVLGRIDAVRVAEHRKVVAAYGLAGDLPDGSNRDELIALMRRDKKAVDGMTFVLDGPNGVELVSGITSDSIVAAFEAMQRGRQTAVIEATR